MLKIITIIITIISSGWATDLIIDDALEYFRGSVQNKNLMAVLHHSTQPKIIRLLRENLSTLIRNKRSYLLLVAAELSNDIKLQQQSRNLLTDLISGENLEYLNFFSKMRFFGRYDKERLRTIFRIFSYGPKEVAVGGAKLLAHLKFPYRWLQSVAEDNLDSLSPYSRLLAKEYIRIKAGEFAFKTIVNRHIDQSIQKFEKNNCHHNYPVLTDNISQKRVTSLILRSLKESTFNSCPVLFLIAEYSGNNKLQKMASKKLLEIIQKGDKTFNRTRWSYYVSEFSNFIDLNGNIFLGTATNLLSKLDFPYEEWSTQAEDYLRNDSDTRGLLVKRIMMKRFGEEKLQEIRRKDLEKSLEMLIGPESYRADTKKHLRTIMENPSDPHVIDFLLKYLAELTNGPWSDLSNRLHVAAELSGDEQLQKLNRSLLEKRILNKKDSDLSRERRDDLLQYEDIIGDDCYDGLDLNSRHVVPGLLFISFAHLLEQSTQNDLEQKLIVKLFTDLNLPSVPIPPLRYQNKLLKKYIINKWGKEYFTQIQTKFLAKELSYYISNFSNSDKYNQFCNKLYIQTTFSKPSKIVQKALKGLDLESVFSPFYTLLLLYENNPEKILQHEKYLRSTIAGNNKDFNSAKRLVYYIRQSSQTQNTPVPERLEIRLAQLVAKLSVDYDSIKKQLEESPLLLESNRLAQYYIREVKGEDYLKVILKEHEAQYRKSEVRRIINRLENSSSSVEYDYRQLIDLAEDEVIYSFIKKEIARLSASDDHFKFRWFLTIGYTFNDEKLKNYIQSLIINRINGQDSIFNKKIGRTLITKKDRAEFYFNEIIASNSNFDTINNLILDLGIEYSLLQEMVERLSQTGGNSKIKQIATKYIIQEKGAYYLANIKWKKRTRSIIINGGHNYLKNFIMSEDTLKTFNERLFYNDSTILNAGGKYTGYTKDYNTAHLDLSFPGTEETTVKETTISATNENIKSTLLEMHNYSDLEELAVVFIGHGNKGVFGTWYDKDLTIEDIQQSYKILLPKTLIRSIFLQCFSGSMIVNNNRVNPEKFAQMEEFTNLYYPANKCDFAFSSEDEVGRYYNHWDELLSRYPRMSLQNIKDYILHDNGVYSTPVLTSDYLLKDINQTICNEESNYAESLYYQLRQRSKKIWQKIQQHLCNDANLKQELKIKEKAINRSMDHSLELEEYKEKWALQAINEMHPEFAKHYEKTIKEIESIEEQYSGNSIIPEELQWKLKELRTSSPLEVEKASMSLYLSHKYENFFEEKANEHLNIEHSFREEVGQSGNTLSSDQIERKEIAKYVQRLRKVLIELLLQDPKLEMYRNRYMNIRKCEKSPIN